MALLQIADPDKRDRVVVGIDLGTTNSLLAVVKNGKPVMPGETQSPMPSLAHYHEGDKISVGEAAIEGLACDPLNTVASVKRLMGRGSGEIDLLQAGMSCPIVSIGQTLGTRTVAGDVSAVETSATILSELARRARPYLSGDIEGAVVTIPAYFDDAQRQATRDAAKLAGLPLLRLLSEPAAAALAYGLDLNEADGRLTLIYDLGGGTFDVSLLRLEGKVFETLATGGDSLLGGDDIDQIVARHISEQAGCDALDPAEQRQMLSLARAAKESFSSAESFSWQWRDASGELGRENFEMLIKPLIQCSIQICEQTLQAAQIERQTVQDIVLVGGSTRILALRKSIAEWSGNKPLSGIDPDRVVAFGAALQADRLIGNRNASDQLLLDVLPLSVGVEVMGGLVETVIPRNTPIPASMARNFTTFKDGQTAMNIHVLQGERDHIKDCRSLARFELRGIPAMRAGAARIEVLFQVDADGVLQVSASEQTSGVEAKVNVSPSSGLNEEQIENMLRASFEHAEDDKRLRALAERQLEAQILLDRLAEMLNEDDKILEAEEQANIEGAMARLSKSCKSSDPQRIMQDINALNTICESFVQRRMNATLRQALSGHALDEVSARIAADERQSQK